LIAVEVLNEYGYGLLYDILDCVEWTVTHMEDYGAKGIISMSIGAKLFEPINKVVQDASDAGIVVVTAAGNGNDDACYYFPASVGFGAM